MQLVMTAAMPVTMTMTAFGFGRRHAGEKQRRGEQSRAREQPGISEHGVFLYLLLMNRLRTLRVNQAESESE
jgi:hypothetical protein